MSVLLAVLRSLAVLVVIWMGATIFMLMIIAATLLGAVWLSGGVR